MIFTTLFSHCPAGKISLKTLTCFHRSIVDVIIAFSTKILLLTFLLFTMPFNIIGDNTTANFNGNYNDVQGNINVSFSSLLDVSETLIVCQNHYNIQNNIVQNNTSSKYFIIS